MREDTNVKTFLKDIFFKLLVELFTMFIIFTTSIAWIFLLLKYKN